MESVKKYKKIIFVLIPLLLSFIINSFILLLLPIYSLLIWPLCIGFIVYWFWVGKQFAKVKFNKILGFILGNSLWGISFALYIWQFVILDDSSRNMLLAVLSQYYNLFTTPLATRIITLFSNVINSTEITVLSYVLMIIIFSLGFIYQLIRMRINQNNALRE